MRGVRPEIAFAYHLICYVAYCRHDAPALDDTVSRPHRTFSGWRALSTRGTSTWLTLSVVHFG